jgi:thiamine biosynthesis protein ThiS
VNVTINGESRRLVAGTTLGALLREFGLSEAGIAVALNARVVARSALESQALSDGDEVEIVRAVSGG